MYQYFIFLATYRIFKMFIYVPFLIWIKLYNINNSRVARTRLTIELFSASDQSSRMRIITSAEWLIITSDSREGVVEEVSVEGVFYLRAIISFYLRSPNSDLSLVTSEKAIKMVLWRLDQAVTDCSLLFNFIVYAT